MNKIMVIDDAAIVATLYNDLLRGEYDVFFAADRISAENLYKKNSPCLVIVNPASQKCMAVLDALRKLAGGKISGVIFVGRIPEKLSVLSVYAPLDAIVTPFVPEDFVKRIDEAIITVTGQRDELTGLYKKACFDRKLHALLDKQTSGTLISINADALSFASNPATPAQLQLCVYAMKTEIPGALLGINGDTIYAYIVHSDTRKVLQKRLDKLLSVLLQAAGEPPVYISIGAADGSDCDFNFDEMSLLSDRALGLARSSGKNCHKFYR